MKTYLKSAALLVIGAIIGIASYQFAPTSAFSQGAQSDPMCQRTRIQVPTTRGLEWKRLDVCNDTE